MEVNFKMEIALFLITFFSSGILQTYASTDIMQHERVLVKCEADQGPSTSESDPVSGASTLDCARQCSADDSCSGVDVCPPGPGLPGVTCGFRHAEEPTECNGSPGSSPSACVFWRNKMDTSSSAVTPGPTTPQPACPQNNALPSTSIRDCEEAYANNTLSPEESKLFAIQPVASLCSFVVFCDNRSEGLTIPFRRTGSSGAFNQAWNNFKMGFGDNVLSQPNPVNFFSGMDNLHTLLDQARYDLLVFLQYTSTSGNGTHYANVTYANFSIGPESTAYAVTYDAFEANGSEFGDVFSSMTPVVFSALGNDTNGCFSERNMRGWYGRNCTGHSFFSNGYLNYITAGGQVKEIDWMQFGFLRVGPFKVTPQ